MARRETISTTVGELIAALTDAAVELGLERQDISRLVSVALLDLLVRVGEPDATGLSLVR
jgi:hypothetical protein